ncbi:unnamed protein product [Chondrus crispus]|uniref:Calcineurin-like phosphoesterase domain-containing protein n=1 Tax=Chondrus crispus TaxID=2769 RepID=R7QIB2_CHOCR|nr:unnamed protein product [Chondrus crispus]CDF37814.1 unnamed protein product [Chondrus crispus]|eukprot:XP_005717685.1 unnamed protein product [Chondrus crispus]
MPLELAADVFEELSARHQRDSIYANRRILCLAAASILVTVFVIIAAIDSSRTSSARRYANAINWKSNAALHCDDTLGKRRLWFGNIVEFGDFCVPHNLSNSKIRTDEDQVLKFIVIGDWGRDGMCCQRDVAAEMAVAASRIHPQFVVSVGDNFYNSGIKSSKDDQVDRSWRDVYIKPYKSLQDVRWKPILGNHDYAGNVEALIDLGKEDSLWHMPSKYYFETAAGGDVFMAYIDTTVMYYTQQELLALSNSDELSTSYRDKQVAVIKKELAESTAKWKIIFGHHPFFASDEHTFDEEHNRRQLQTTLMHVFKEHNVSIYFGGHSHTLEHHHSDGIDFFVSGAGSKISQIHRNLPTAMFVMDRQGYMIASMDDTKEHLRVQVIDMRGNIIYTVLRDDPQFPMSKGIES